MSKILIAGDWHINTEWATHVIMRAAQKGIYKIVHVGDFGFWSHEDGQRYLATVQTYLEIYKVEIFVTGGNHEDWPYLHSLTEVSPTLGYRHDTKYPNIHIADRGAQWEWEGVKFASLGGANSINRYGLTPNIDWFAEEQITLGDVYKTIDAGHVDVLITHDAPVSAKPVQSDEGLLQKFGKEGIAYSLASAEQIEVVVNALKPKFNFHGHYHVSGVTTLTFGDENTQVYSLDKEYTFDNYVTFDLTTKQVIIEEN